MTLIPFHISEVWLHPCRLANTFSDFLKCMVVWKSTTFFFIHSSIFLSKTCKLHHQTVLSMTEPIPILIVWITPWNDKARISPGDYHSKTDLGHKLLYIFLEKIFSVKFHWNLVSFSPGNPSKCIDSALCEFSREPVSVGMHYFKKLNCLCKCLW